MSTEERDRSRAKARRELDFHSVGLTVGSTPYSDHQKIEVVENDPVNNPSHYQTSKGVQVIDLTEELNFNRGNAVKYIFRAGKKDPATEVQDLQKALFYIGREINRVEAEYERQNRDQHVRDLFKPEVGE